MYLIHTHTIVHWPGHTSRSHWQGNSGRGLNSQDRGNCTEWERATVQDIIHCIYFAGHKYYATAAHAAGCIAYPYPYTKCNNYPHCFYLGLFPGLRAQLLVLQVTKTGCGGLGNEASFTPVSGIINMATVSDAPQYWYRYFEINICLTGTDTNAFTFHTLVLCLHVLQLESLLYVPLQEQLATLRHQISDADTLYRYQKKNTETAQFKANTNWYGVVQTPSLFG